MGCPMADPAERMRLMRQRRRRLGLRELRLVVPDARSEAVRQRIAAQVAALNRDNERDALRWIEAVSEFDVDQPR
jgi:antidote-toxin recognition MazE-like antitoxin